MPSFQQFQQQLVQELFGAASSATGAVSPALTSLIDALPYYGDPDFEAAHRGALTNLLEVNMPNSGIAAQPDQAGVGYYSVYAYSGSFSGYQSFFFSGISQTSPAASVADVVLAENQNMHDAWWGNYAVSVLTDAIRLTIPITLDTGKLAGDLSNANAAFLPCLAGSYYAVYQNGFSPTANALGVIVSTGQTQQACTSLQSLISSGQFTANVNQAISLGGDSTAAAVWFLFNLWITLKALGCSNVDGAISQFSTAGLNVPAEVGPQSWWNGGYTSWYSALSGSDLAGLFQPAITADMPETETSSIGDDTQPFEQDVSLSDGYSQSLCYWSGINWYKPQSSSCFGKGTGVLMADGSVQPIEDVRMGDELHTNSGTAKVILVESPPRANRLLYRINGLNVYATAGHPFRSAADASAARCTVEPWSLADTAQTMMFDGIDALAPGSRLAGLLSGAPGEITVYDLQRLEPEPGRRLSGLRSDPRTEGGEHPGLLCRRFGHLSRRRRRNERRHARTYGGRSDCRGDGNRYRKLPANASRRSGARLGGDDLSPRPRQRSPRCPHRRLECIGAEACAPAATAPRLLSKGWTLGHSRVHAGDSSGSQVRADGAKRNRNGMAFFAPSHRIRRPFDPGSA